MTVAAIKMATTMSGIPILDHVDFKNRLEKSQIASQKRKHASHASGVAPYRMARNSTKAATAAKRKSGHFSPMPQGYAICQRNSNT
jgi:hypothetical protein